MMDELTDESALLGLAGAAAASPRGRETEVGGSGYGGTGGGAPFGGGYGGYGGSARCGGGGVGGSGGGGASAAAGMAMLAAGASLPISVFVGTWNVGNEQPPEDLTPWLQPRGVVVGMPDLYVLVAQDVGFECTF
jgi:hypothetical protein